MLSRPGEAHLIKTGYNAPAHLHPTTLNNFHGYTQTNPHHNTNHQPDTNYNFYTFFNSHLYSNENRFPNPHPICHTHTNPFPS
jgi:hypothetical protein